MRCSVLLALLRPLGCAAGVLCCSPSLTPAHGAWWSRELEEKIEKLEGKLEEQKEKLAKEKHKSKCGAVWGCLCSKPLTRVCSRARRKAKKKLAKTREKFMEMAE